MDNQTPDTNVGDTQDENGDEEIEVTRDELVAALKEVITDLSAGLNGADREAYLSADDLAQNDWFFAGVSDRPGQYAVTMWPAEGDEDMLRIDLGAEEDVHKISADSDQIEALTDDFIDGMSEDYDEEYEDYDEEDEEDEEDEGEEELDENEEEEFEEEEELDEEEEDGSPSTNGHTPGR